MKVNGHVACKTFPCGDIRRESYYVPSVTLDPARISIILISEAAPADLRDHYYAGRDPLFQRTTVQAFQDAGTAVTSVRDILDLGVYLTTAVKCGKSGYGIETDTVRECSFLLEKEISLFTHNKAFLLMGDVAIKAVNSIARRNGEPRVIPTGSTYRIRGQPFFFRGKRVFPSYLQAGPGFFIEKSKRRMIAEDIAAALRLLE